MNHPDNFRWMNHSNLVRADIVNKLNQNLTEIINTHSVESQYIVKDLALLTICVDKDLILLWRLNECKGVSNHQHHDCLPNRLFRHKSKKTSKLPHKGPVTRKMFPSDDVIMLPTIVYQLYSRPSHDLAVWSMPATIGWVVEITRYRMLRFHWNYEIWIHKW